MAPPDEAKKSKPSAKLEELNFLESSIGVTGKLAIKPFLRMSQKDLWQFYMLSG